MQPLRPSDGSGAGPVHADASVYEWVVSAGDPGGTRVKYLTRSYVEWLGLPLVPFAHRRTGAVSCMWGENACLPAAGQSRWDDGVVHDGRAYVREPDGLAYVRTEGLRWA